MTREPTPPRDRFAGLFEGELPDIAEGSLLDTPTARAWLELIDRTVKAGDYTFQAPMSGKAGPWITIDGQRMLNLSSYDYLGLIGDERLEQVAVEAIRLFGTGTGGVRLLTGTNELHTQLERCVADFKGTDRAMVFTSGFMANLAAIGALFGLRDRAVLDEHVHRSVIDACRVARVPFERFAHNDVASLDRALEAPHHARRTVVIVDGVYSMDGDLAPLPAIVEAKNRHGALLMVDEAHSFG
ncbi:MAG TPA: aminotransferase class I/II-fold pyridoxal phosphate-dependent enzyme, partial [Longimicrobiales bacterium]|nr:aminotransferase class I/II-fold pyridoxal phosphate-dependent enzyme [Longimicrobiales bacterium]